MRLAASQQKDGVTPEIAALLLSKSTGFRPPASTSQACQSQCDHHVQALTGDPAPQTMGSAFINPLLWGVVGQRPTLTNKLQGGWSTFKKRWDQHMATVIACNNGLTPPDFLMLQHLAQALEQDDRLLLEHQLENCPSLTFKEFWDHLVSLYDRDTQAQLRMAWEAVLLPGGELTLEKWLNFWREFQLKRDRVDDKTPQEEYKLLMRTLPETWQTKVVEEESRRGSKKFLVRMTNTPPGLTDRELRAQMEEESGVKSHLSPLSHRGGDGGV